LPSYLNRAGGGGGVAPSPLPSKRCNCRKAKRHSQGTGLVVEVLGSPPKDVSQKQTSITGIDRAKFLPPSGSSRAFRYQLAEGKLPTISPCPINQAVAFNSAGSSKPHPQAYTALLSIMRIINSRAPEGPSFVPG